MTDFLAEQVAMVVRYQGGDNAGHTVVNGDEVFKLRLTPSGVLYPHITSVIGNGVVVNPLTLIDELDMLTSRGIDVSRVRVSRSAHVIMPYHVALDVGNETRLGDAKVGHDRAGDRTGLRRSSLADRAAHGGPARSGRRCASGSRACCRTRTCCSGRWAAQRFELEPLVAAWRSAGASGCAPTSTTRPGSSRVRSPAASTSCSRAPRARSSTSTTGATRS